MFAKSKTVFMSSMLALGVATAIVGVPASAYAAPNNGWGIVYNKSDCGVPNVRFYGLGGRGGGSTCGRWIDKTFACVVWSDSGHNFTDNDMRAGTFHHKCSGGAWSK